MKYSCSERIRIEITTDVPKVVHLVVPYIVRHVVVWHATRCTCTCAPGGKANAACIHSCTSACKDRYPRMCIRHATSNMRGYNIPCRAVMYLRAYLAVNKRQHTSPASQHAPNAQRCAFTGTASGATTPTRACNDRITCTSGGTVHGDFP